MNFLLLNYEFPPLGGGAGNATYNIAKALAYKGHKVTVLTSSYKDLPDHEKMEGFEVHRVKSLRKRKDRSNVMEMLDFVRKGRKVGAGIIEANKPDKIISFFALPTGLLAHYFKKKFKVPYILSLRGGDVPGFLPNDLKWLHFITMPLTKIVWSDADKIVANSWGLRDLALNTAKPIGKDVVYVPNGVDAEMFFPKPELKKHNIINMLFVGRLVPQKNVKNILQALHYNNANNKLNTEWHLNIVGDGPLRKDLERVRNELDLQNMVTFKGWVGKKELIKDYQSSDILLLPSKEEGMSNVILEALACGLPVLTTNKRGNNELIKHNFNGVIIDDLDRLPNAIEDLINDGNQIRIISNDSRNTALEFSWSEVAEKYKNLIK